MIVDMADNVGRKRLGKTT